MATPLTLVVMYQVSSTMEVLYGSPCTALSFSNTPVSVNTGAPANATYVSKAIGISKQANWVVVKQLCLVCAYHALGVMHMGLTPMGVLQMGVPAYGVMQLMHGGVRHRGQIHARLCLLGIVFTRLRQASSDMPAPT